MYICFQSSLHLTLQIVEQLGFIWSLFASQVIEYIQYLQEKVTKYEGPYQGWNHDPAKLMPWVIPFLLFTNYVTCNVEELYLVGL